MGAKAGSLVASARKIEGTDVQAIVAAEDAIAHLSSEIVRDDFAAAAQFDCQVGDTESGIDDIGLDDGAGRTSLNTEGTASAQICGWFIVFRSRVVRISPSRSHEPHSAETRLECFPIQPRPACCAQAFSMIGPVST